DDIGLDPIAIEAGTSAGVVDGIEDGEELPRPVTVAERGERHDRPDGAVRVLAPVFPDAGRIGPDITRIATRTDEGRGEEEHEGLLAPDEVLLHRAHGLG